MEVHRHAHSPRQSPKHYFWEFFMLFLAVFCAYQSERIFEHNIEKARAVTFMNSLHGDLVADTNMINRIRQKRLIREEKLLRLILLMGVSDVKNREKEVYDLARNSDDYESFVRNDGTIQQLKNSGGMRLIKKDSVGPAIMEYDNFIVSEVDWNNRTEAARIDHYKKLRFQLFDVQLLNKIIMLQDPEKRKLLKDTTLIYTFIKGASATMINEITGALFQVMRISETCRESGDTAIAKATELIHLIKRKYRIREKKH